MIVNRIMSDEKSAFKVPPPPTMGSEVELEGSADNWLIHT